MQAPAPAPAMGGSVSAARPAGAFRLRGGLSTLTLWPIYREDDGRRMFHRPCGSWAFFCWNCGGATLATLWPCGATIASAVRAGERAA